MSLAEDLLSQATMLIRKERRRPRQASLRRALSTAYYALFHLLVSDASKLLSTKQKVRNLVGRAFAHGDMKAVSKWYASGGLPVFLHSAAPAMPVPKELKDVAETFVEAQEARHHADYNLARVFLRSDAKELVDRVAAAFAKWKSVRNHDHAQLFLAALLLADRIRRPLENA